MDRNFLAVGINHENQVGQPAHFANAAQSALQLGLLACQLQHLLLGQAQRLI